MRNKKSLLSLGILALVLVLGVGYAAISEQVLNITGTAESDDRTIEVHFKEVTDSESSYLTIEANGEITDETNATITVTGLSEEGDNASVTYSIANEDVNLEANVTPEVVSVLSEQGEDLSAYYQVTFENAPVVIGKSAGTNPGMEEITVRVTLTKVPITEDESKANNVIKITATPQQPGTASS